MDMKMFEPTTMSDLGAPLPIAEISALLGVEITSAHQALLDAFEGPVMLADGVEIRPAKPVPMMSGETFSLDLILGRNSGRHGLAAAFDTYGERLVQSVPVAELAGGDLLVMERDTGRIYFWDHEADHPEDQLDVGALVADSFEDLLNRLETVQRAPRQVRAKKVDLRF